MFLQRAKKNRNGKKIVTGEQRIVLAAAHRLAQQRSAQNRSLRNASNAEAKRNIDELFDSAQPAT
jgi:hypothetical protein